MHSSILLEPGPHCEYHTKHTHIHKHCILLPTSFPLTSSPPEDGSSPPPPPPARWLFSFPLYYVYICMWMVLSLFLIVQFFRFLRTFTWFLIVCTFYSSFCFIFLINFRLLLLVVVVVVEVLLSIVFGYYFFILLLLFVVIYLIEFFFVRHFSPSMKTVYKKKAYYIEINSTR